MAAHPRRRKFKVRTRTYLASRTSFLEVKAVGPRGVTVKERIACDFDDAMQARLSDESAAWLEGRLLAAGQPPDTGAQLAPVMSGSYHRTTLLMADGTGRATVDTQLDWASRDSYLERPDMAVVETKSGSRPSEVDQLLWASGHRPARISKFGTGMSALNSSLPRNRWNRVLNNYFS